MKFDSYSHVLSARCTEPVEEMNGLLTAAAAQQA
jgi:hypothetical protein